MALSIDAASATIVVTAAHGGGSGIEQRLATASAPLGTLRLGMAGERQGGDIAQEIGIADRGLGFGGQRDAVDIGYFIEQALGRSFARIAVFFVRLGYADWGYNDRRVQQRLQDNDETDHSRQHACEDDDRRLGDPVKLRGRALRHVRMDTARHCKNDGPDLAAGSESLSGASAVAHVLHVKAPQSWAWPGERTRRDFWLAS